MAVGDAFNKSVDYYDDWVRTALPSYDEIFSIARELIPFHKDRTIDVLDLGAGTGLFFQHVFSKYPQARFVLVDLAVRMLDVAKVRFQHHLGQFEFVVQDYRRLPEEKLFDLVISSLSIHHLENDEKRDLFRQVYQRMSCGGVFINIDQIKGPTPELQELYWENWLKEIRENGAAEEQIRASVQRRKEFDRDAGLVEQLTWLEEAGFDSVDCVYKNYFIGIFHARKMDKDL